MSHCIIGWWAALGRLRHRAVQAHNSSRGAMDLRSHQQQLKDVFASLDSGQMTPGSCYPEFRELPLLELQEKGTEKRLQEESRTGLEHCLQSETFLQGYFSARVTV